MLQAILSFFALLSVIISPAPSEFPAEPFYEQTTLSGSVHNRHLLTESYIPVWQEGSQVLYKKGNGFQINTYTAGSQSYPSVTSLGSDKFVVTWESYLQDGSGDGIYGQIFNSSASPLGSEFRINNYTTSDQQYPSVTSLGSDKFVVTWMSDGQDGDNWGIYGQLFDSSASPLGSEFRINTYTISYQEYPSVTSLGNDKFVVTWASNGQDGSNYGVYGQLFNSNASPLGSEFQINTYTTDNQFFSSVTSLGSDKFVVTWMSFWQDGNWGGVYGQLFDSNASSLGNEFRINTYTTSNQNYPSVTSLGSDKFVVTWQSNGQDGGYYGIYGQIFNSSAYPLGSEFRVNTYTALWQAYSSVTSLGSDKFVVTWQSDGQEGDFYGVYGQLFDSSASPLGSEFRINTYTTYEQQSPSVTGLGSDKFVVTWHSWGQDGSDWGIYGQILKLGITLTPTVNPTNSPTTNPTNLTNSPSRSPTSNPSKSPTFNPTLQPTKYPTQIPSKNPTNSPSSTPSVTPSSSPSNNPSDFPSINPTLQPTKYPTNNPSQAPSSNPTLFPSLPPTQNPTSIPSTTPSNNPSYYPSTNPTLQPTKDPTQIPSKNPTSNPSQLPSITPSNNPTTPPSRLPTVSPTLSPTQNPSKYPTSNPSQFPSLPPTQSPTHVPSKTPSNYPSLSPSINPTPQPTKSPTQSPSKHPTNNPTQNPSYSPSGYPSTTPSNYPTLYPSSHPTQNPTYTPSGYPFITPTIPPQKSSDNTFSTLVVIGFVGLSGLVLIFLVGSIYCCYRRNGESTKKNINQAISMDIIKNNEQNQSGFQLRDDHSDIEKNSDESISSMYLIRNILPQETDEGLYEKGTPIAVNNGNSDTGIIDRNEGTNFFSLFNTSRNLSTAKKTLFNHNIESNKKKYTTNINNQKTLLHIAVMDKEPFTTIQFIIKKSKVNINALDEKDKTALDYTSPDSKVHQFLQSEGAYLGIDVELFEVVKNGKIENLIRLIEQGASLKLLNNQNKSLIEIAEQAKNYEVAFWLQKKKIERIELQFKNKGYQNNHNNKHNEIPHQELLEILNSSQNLGRKEEELDPTVEGEI